LWRGLGCNCSDGSGKQDTNGTCRQVLRVQHVVELVAMHVGGDHRGGVALLHIRAVRDAMHALGQHGDGCGGRVGEFGSGEAMVIRGREGASREAEAMVRGLARAHNSMEPFVLRVASGESSDCVVCEEMANRRDARGVGEACHDVASSFSRAGARDPCVHHEQRCGEGGGGLE
jgi:hypothetical protein